MYGCSARKLGMRRMGENDGLRLGNRTAPGHAMSPDVEVIVLGDRTRNSALPVLLPALIVCPLPAGPNGAGSYLSGVHTAKVAPVTRHTGGGGTVHKPLALRTSSVSRCNPNNH